MIKIHQIMKNKILKNEDDTFMGHIVILTFWEENGQWVLRDGIPTDNNKFKQLSAL